jgi:DNA-directed RNA polymerase specialized sigma24 family protein
VSGSGYGDALSVEEALAQKEALFQIMVSERHVDPEMRDDVLQEARIVAWQVLTSDKEYGNRDQYAHAAARRRIVETATRQTWTGHTRVHGQPTDPLRQAGKEPLEAVELVAAEVLSDIDAAYHHGQVYAAIRALPEPHREYVYQRFWLGMTEPEMAAYAGRSVATVSRWWLNDIRPTLRHALADVW